MKQIFAIQDLKGGFYGNPFTCVNADIALRILDSLLSQENSDYRRYPSDFILVRLGTYNSVTGSGSFETPTPVISVQARLDYLRMLYLEQQRTENQVTTESDVDNAEA